MNYIEEAMRTRSGKYNECNHDIEHGIIGLMTESVELLESIINCNLKDDLDYVNILEECGDLCWYLAILCFGYGWKFEDFKKMKKPNNVEMDEVVIDSIDRINISAGKMLDCLKKYHFYGVVFDDKYMKTLSQIIFNNINLICFACNTDIEKIKETNIKKLKARYPDKWTKETATDRDLENERSILEENRD